MDYIKIQLPNDDILKVNLNETNLTLFNCILTSIPAEIGNLQSLQILNLKNNFILYIKFPNKQNKLLYLKYLILKWQFKL